MTRKSLCVINSKVLERMRRNMPQRTKNAFSVPRAHGLKKFQNIAHNSNLERSSDESECMAISIPEHHENMPV